MGIVHDNCLVQLLPTLYHTYILNQLLLYKVFSHPRRL